MFAKAQIDAEKLNPDSTFFKETLAPTIEDSKLLFVLDNLGKLPAGFDGEVFRPLLSHPNAKVRMLTVKNVGKLKDESFLEELVTFARNETDTHARREAVSAIGRMRSEKAIPILSQFLTDTDPKVISQGLRALLCFKGHPEAEEALATLRDHPNEMIREHFANEEIAKHQSNAQHSHPMSLDALKNVIVCADVQEMFTIIPDESVHLTFTSPPYYNARDYTIFQSYEAYLDFLTTVFKETHRITKEGRFFVLNTSPVIVPRISRAHSSKRYAIPYDMHPRLTEMGWEFIDDLVWIKPEYAAKNRNGGFFQHRKPLCYKANSVTESVMVYRKKTGKLIDWNLQQYDDETIEASKVLGDYEKSNAWQINPATDKGHPAVFPTELASRIVQFYSFKGDLIFDPFAGSGTVGRVAIDHERYFLLCEQEPEYVEHIRQAWRASLLYSSNLRVLSLTDLENNITERNKKMMTITGTVVKNIIQKLLAGEDYRSEVLALINAKFLEYVVDFFKRIVSAKLDNQDVTVDWYEKEFLLSSLPKEEIAIHAGLNMKTINNAYNTTKKEVVLEASMENYHRLYEAINDLTEQSDVNVTLTIKFRDVSVDLNINESLVVINTLAVKRSALRGGLWSTAGKQVEKPLMMTLCALFQVPIPYYAQKNLPTSARESDFYLFDDARIGYRCEVKLAGKGNPEAPDSIFARDGKILVGDTISDTMKQEMDENNILWVELRAKDGYKQFEKVLNELSIPCKPHHGDLKEDLDKILPLLRSDDTQTSVTPEISNSESDLLIELG